MRTKLYLLVILLISWLLSGIIITYPLSGKAIDAATGEPIAGVRVVGYNYNYRGNHRLAFDTITGDDGRFKVKTSYQVKILFFKKGYETVLVHALHGENNQLFIGELKPIRKKEGREIGNIVGTVRERAGIGIRPASEVKVILYINEIPTEHITTTDSLGFYILDNIPVGNYKLELSKDGYLTSKVDCVVAKTESITFHEFDILSTDEPTKLWGQVRECKKHKPLPKVKVELTNEDGLVTSSDVSDNNGFYCIDNVPRGYTLIRFSRMGYKPKNMNVELLWSNDTLVNVELTPKLFWLFRLFSKKYASLTGQVLDGETGDALSLISVAVRKDGKMETGTYADFKGEFLIENILPGMYELEFALMGYDPCKMNVKIQSGTENFFHVKLTGDKSIIVK